MRNDSCQIKDKPSKGLLLLLILFAFSCEKKSTSPDVGDTIFLGTIVDANTNQPMKDVAILKVHRCSYPMYDTSLVAKTDKDGKFQFKQAIIQSTDPSKACYDDFITQYNGYSTSGISYKIGAINESNIRLLKSSFLKFHLKNVTNSWDKFILNIGSTSSFVYYNPANIDKIVVAILIPNNTHSIEWITLKSGKSTASGNENIYFASGDTIHRDYFY